MSIGRTGGTINEARYVRRDFHRRKSPRTSRKNVKSFVSPRNRAVRPRRARARRARPAPQPHRHAPRAMTLPPRLAQTAVGLGARGPGTKSETTDRDDRRHV